MGKTYFNLAGELCDASKTIVVLIFCNEILRLKCITFGSPLIGDENFASDLKKLPCDLNFGAQPYINFIHKVCYTLAIVIASADY